MGAACAAAGRGRGGRRRGRAGDPEPRVRGRIALADAAALAGQLRRARLARVGLAAALLVTLAALLAAAGSLDERESSTKTSAAVGQVIVLDVSASVRPERYAPVAAVLRAASAKPDARRGLVLFSDT